MSMERDAPDAAVDAAFLGLALPPECVAGVAANLAVLAAHLRLLDGFEEEA